jgi:hypothetical protein
MKVERTCGYCSTISTVEVDAAGYKQWQQGALIQNAFPDLPAEQRDLFLRVPLCPSCSDKLLGVS